MATRQRREQLTYLYQQMMMKPPQMESDKQESHNSSSTCDQIVSGDFNFQFKDEPQTFLDAGFIDAWRSLHPRGKITGVIKSQIHIYQSL